MPIQVDLTERRAAIADATVRVAARKGLQAVTIRSVAAELGASLQHVKPHGALYNDAIADAKLAGSRNWRQKSPASKPPMRFGGPCE